MYYTIDGQKIANKLSKQIRNATKQSEALIHEYNACLSDEESADFLTVEEVLDPIKLEDRLQALGVWCVGTVPERREAMDAYLMFIRSKEEQAMVKEELQAVVTFYGAKKDRILEDCCEVQLLTDSLYSRGISALLHRLLHDVTRLLDEAQIIFYSLDKPDENELYCCDNDSDEDDSDDDDDN